MSDYDVIVLGGGSAGTSAASAAAAAGARTLMINDGELGGLCILRGCMPTKAMLASAHALHETRHLDPLGLTLEGTVEPDFARIMQRKDALVARFKRAKLTSIERGDYEVLDGRGRFAEGGGVEVDGRRITARRYVIATGSKVAPLPIPGYERIEPLTSDGVMRLDEQPESLLVYGAGPIGLELGQFFARIGTRVLQVNRSELLYRYDVDCGAELRRALEEEENLELAVPAMVTALKPEGNKVRATVESATDVTEHVVDRFLAATGRLAAVDDLGLEHVGLAESMWKLQVDETMRTPNPDIYVAGDTTGRFQILHLANQEGAAAGHNAAVGQAERRVDYRLKMSVIFTDPPFAQVGYSAPEAAAAGIEIATGQARFPETGRAITMEVRHGLWKLFARKDDGRILGSVILGPRADDLIHLVSVMMHYDGGHTDIGRLPWYHPTLSEVMMNLGRELDAELGDEPGS